MNIVIGFLRIFFCRRIRLRTTILEKQTQRKKCTQPFLTLGGFVYVWLSLLGRNIKLLRKHNGLKLIVKGHNIVFKLMTFTCSIRYVLDLTNPIFLLLLFVC